MFSGTILSTFAKRKPFDPKSANSSTNPADSVLANDSVIGSLMNDTNVF